MINSTAKGQLTSARPSFALGGCCEHSRRKPGGVGDIDLAGRRYHGQAAGRSTET